MNDTTSDWKELAAKMLPSIHDQYELKEYPDVVIDTTYACNVVCKMCHLYSPYFKIPKSPHILVVVQFEI